jgi:hypothetical protein
MARPPPCRCPEYSAKAKAHHNLRSDRRLKTDIVPIKDALSRLSQLRGVTFDWKNPDLHGGKAAAGGFIAQELKQVFPVFVSQAGLQSRDNNQSRAATE